MREVLAAHLGCAARGVTLDRTGAGKPRHASGIEFSVAHCPGLLAVAVGADAPLGVDAEPRGRPVDASAFRRLMTAAERAQLDLWGPEAIVPWWVRKEAVLKAAGVGLRADLRDWPAPVSPLARSRRLIARNGAVHRVLDVRFRGHALAVARAGGERFGLVVRSSADPESAHPA